VKNLETPAIFREVREVEVMAIDELKPPG